MKHLFAILLIITVQCSSNIKNIAQSESYYKEAKLNYDNKRYIAAIEIFNKSINSNSDNDFAYLYRAMCKKEIKDYIGSIDDLNIFIKHNPDIAEGYSLRGSTKEEVFDYSGAISDYNNAVKFKPDDYYLFYKLGLVKYKMNNYSESLFDFNKSIALNPLDVSSYNLRGYTKRFLNDYDGAISDYLKAIELSPKIAYPYNSLAWLYATCKNKKYRNGIKSLELVKKAISLDKSDPHFIDTLAACFAEIGNFKSAIIKQQEAIFMLKSTGEQEDLLLFNKRLESYKNNKSWVE